MASLIQISFNFFFIFIKRTHCTGSQDLPGFWIIWESTCGSQNTILNLSNFVLLSGLVLFLFVFLKDES